MQDTEKSYKIFNRDMMKYFAIIPMFIGHAIGWINAMYHPDDPLALYKISMPLMILSGFSLICPPVMFFFITDGFKYTRDRKKYAQRLLLFACITQPFSWLIFQPINGWWTGNVIFTLFFGLLALIAWESGLKKWQRIVLVILCCLGTVLVQADWIVFGVLFILFLHIFREKPKQRAVAYFSLALIHSLANLVSLGKVPAANLIIYILVMIASFTIAYLSMTTFYNGKKGKHPTFAKWFFYAFYPLHHLVIFAIKICMDKF